MNKYMERGMSTHEKLVERIMREENMTELEAIEAVEERKYATAL